MTEHEAWLLIAEAFKQYPEPHEEVCNMCGLCYAADGMRWRNLITNETYGSMLDRIKSKLEPGTVYLAKYTEEGAKLRVEVALEFAAECSKPTVE